MAHSRMDLSAIPTASNSVIVSITRKAARCRNSYLDLGLDQVPRKGGKTKGTNTSFENHRDGLVSRTFSRIELLTTAHQCSSGKREVILMVGRASPSETLAWWARAAQARRVAGMLSPRDAQLAEAYATECEDQARGASSGARFVRSAVAPTVRNPIPNSVGRVSPRQLLFCEDSRDSSWPAGSCKV
jgi:hypothetical protein